MESVQLIVNADDLGYSHERDIGIFNAFRQGIVTASSAMMNGASVNTALATAAAEGFAIGLHLNFTEGHPVAADSVASLIDPSNGKFMRGKMGFRGALAAGQIEPNHLRIEAEAQLAAFVALHPRHELPTHWDGHQHVQVLPQVMDAVLPVFAGKVPCARLSIATEDVDVVPAPRRSFYHEIDAQSRAALPSFLAAGALVPDVFVGYTTMGADMAVPGRVLQVLEKAVEAARAPGSRHHCIEWMVHPGYRTRPRPTADAGAGTATAAASGAGTAIGGQDGGQDMVIVGDAGCGDGPDDFSMSDDRETELTILLDRDGSLRSWLKEHGVQLVSHRQAMQPLGQG